MGVIMKKIICFLLIAYSFSLTSEPFIISEIFANATGKISNKDKAWIELYNISQVPIIIESLQLQIYDHSSLEIFNKEIFLKSPIKFDNFVIIAQKNNLSLSHCLKPQILTVLIPGFAIKNNMEQKVCVVINGHQTACTVIAKKTRFLDGVSIFRDVANVKQVAVWLNEPCHLIDNIFATPGLLPKYCVKQPDFKHEILQNCHESSETNNVLITSLSHGDHHAPTLLVKGLDLRDNSLHLHVDYRDIDGHDLGTLNLCKAPSSSSKICHKLSNDFWLRPGHSYQFSWPYFNFTNNEKLFIKIRDLYGITAVNELTNNLYKTDAADEPFKITIENTTGGQRLNLAVKLDDIPVNLSALNRQGQVIKQMAFIEPGQKSFSIIKPDEVVAIKYVGKSGVRKISLK